MTATSREVTGYLDRFEGDLAVLLLGEEGDHRVNFPRALLPTDAREGVIVRLTLAVDAQATEKGAATNQSLMDELLRESDG